MAIVRQTSFSAGELSPLLWGRTDLELYGHGLRRLSNFVVNQQGNAVSRPGSLLAWAAKQADVLLVPFLHASGESYVLEFGHLYVRIYDARTLVMSTELVTPFQTSDLPELQWAQQGSVLTVVHRLRPPQEISITSAASIVAARTAPLGDTAGAAPMVAVYPSIDGNPPADPVLVAWQPSGTLVPTLFVVDAAHPPREWQYKVSTVVRHILTGQEVETLPRPITKYAEGDVSSGTVDGSTVTALPADNLLVLFPDSPIYIEPGMGDAVTPPANWVAVENLYYRGRGQLFGLVGRAAPNARFADFGEEPNYAIPPLRGESPFAAGEYPSAVGYWQQRRCFAGPGSTWWASAVDEWANFDAPILPWNGQPLEATLLGRRRERIVAMAQLEHLFVITDTSAWQIGRPDVALDYDTLPSVVRLIDEVGGRPRQPLIIDDALLWATAQGRGVRALAPAQGGGFGPKDVSWHAEHLFRGAITTAGGSMESKTVKGWAFQRDPFCAAWVLRNDGRLLTLTHAGDGSWAWAQQDVGGEVISVTSVPRSSATGGLGGWDDVFYAVRRIGGTYIERATPIEPRGIPRYVTDPRYAGLAIGQEMMTYPLDSYVVATVTTATGTTVTGLGHLEGLDVWASCPGITPVGPFRVTGGAITTPAGWGPTGSVTFKAAVGLPFTAELELLDVAGARLSQKNVVSVGFEVDSAVGLEAGQDFDHLTPWRQRDVQDAYEYPSAASALVVVAVAGAWRRRGAAVLRQAKPLPVTVLGVTREVDIGGAG